MNADETSPTYLLGEYIESLTAAGLYVGPPVISIARMFFERIGPNRWPRLSLAEQCALPVKYRRVVGWLLVNCRMAVTPEYLVEVQAFLGGVSSRLQPALYEMFRTQGAELGYDPKSIVQQWSVVAKISALHQCRPDDVTLDMLTNAPCTSGTSPCAESFAVAGVTDLAGNLVNPSPSLYNFVRTF